MMMMRMRMISIVISIIIIDIIAIIVISHEHIEQACRFRFWRLVVIGEKWFRRMGKKLVSEPVVAAEEDAGNEFGTCIVRRENCFRSSSNDLCQVCLRCNVDYQYQSRTFPLATADATEHGAETMRDETRQKKLPGVLGWLARRMENAKATGANLLSSFAVAMRSSSVADYYLSLIHI